MTTAGIGGLKAKGDAGDFGGPAAGRAPLSTLLRRRPSLKALRAFLRAEADAQADRAFVWTPVAFGCGCAVYFSLRQEPPLWPALLGAAFAVALWLSARRWAPSRWMVAAAALVAALACGLLAAELRARAVAGPVIWERRTVTAEGWVVDVASPGSGGGRLVIAPYDVSGMDPAALPRRVRISVGEDALVGPGEAVRLRAVLGPPPGPASPGAYDFARDAWFRGIGAVGFSLSDPRIVEGPRPPVLLGVSMAVNAARWSLSRRIVDELGPREGGIAAAMTTGHEAWLQADDVQDMRDSGLSHILSISGAHMAIVGGFVFFVVRALAALWPWLALRISTKKLAAAAGIAATAAYLVVSGAPPPAVRSAATLFVAFAAILADRRAISLHALALAALIVLLLQPEAVFQPGFQMSFAATAALVALAEAWPRPPREINAPWPIRLVQTAGAWLAVAVAASFVAGLATTPFAIQHFNRISLYGLPANLMMEPLSSFVIMPFLAAGAALESAGLGAWLLQVAGLGVRALLWLAELVAAWPRAVVIVPSAPAVALPIAFMGLLWTCLWKGRLRLIGLPAVLAVALWPRPPAPVAWIASDGTDAAVTQGRTAVFLKPDAKAFASDLWSRRWALARPDLPEAVRDQAFDCDRRRCLPRPGEGPALSAWWTRRPPGSADVAALCRADIVIFRGVRPEGCGAPLVLSAQDFRRGGSAEVFRARSGWRVVWANDLRGDRPWTEAVSPGRPKPGSVR